MYFRADWVPSFISESPWIPCIIAFYAGSCDGGGPSKASQLRQMVKGWDFLVDCYLISSLLFQTQLCSCLQSQFLRTHFVFLLEEWSENMLRTAIPNYPGLILKNLRQHPPYVSLSLFVQVTVKHKSFCLSLTICSYLQVPLKVISQFMGLLSFVRRCCGGVSYKSYSAWQEKSVCFVNPVQSKNDPSDLNVDPLLTDS